VFINVVRHPYGPGETMIDNDESGGRETEVAGNLPAQLTSLVGRGRELSELSALLAGTRLLTLTGPGGAGKSRLGLALARAHRADYPGGAWFVDLTPLSDPDLVAQHVAAALDLAQMPAPAAAPAIAQRLGHQRALFVLDNCEHVADEAGALIAGLLGACPALQVVATSRQSLGVPGEQLFRVGGLAIGAPGDRAGEPGAVDLFLERAAWAAPSFKVTDRTTAAAARVCRWLDGMPLAIELAAARAAVLGVEQIADRLEHDWRLLGNAPRAAPARQQTMYATLEWSHRMLSRGEQALFRRLAVFRGTISLEAVEAVGAADDGERAGVLDVLARLVDHSLVQVVERAGESRYRLLETVRQYGLEKLAESGEADAVRAAHTRYLVDLAERAQAGLAGPEQARWIERLDAERDDLRAVLDRELAEAPETAGRLAGLLWPFWSRRGAYQEARIRLERAAALADQMPPTVRVGVLTGAGVLAFLQCDYLLATARLEAALRLDHELGDRRGVATVLQRLGSIAREQGRYEEARRQHERSQAVWEELDDRSGVAASLDYLGFVAWLEGDNVRAEELGARALATFRATGEAQETAATLINLGAAAGYAGETPLARRRLEEALTVSRQIGYQEGIAWSEHELAILARREHDLPGAAAMLRTSLRLHHELGDRWRTASVLEEIAGGLLVRVDPPRAAELLGAAEALRDALQAPLPPAERPEYERAVEALRERLPPALLERHWETGRARGLERSIHEAIEAMAKLTSRDAPPWRHALADLLTEREQAVLALLRDGHTNREIAAELFISPSTAGVHVSNILRKLGVRSRVQAATLAAQLGLPSAAPTAPAPRSLSGRSGKTRA
jgi:predicted ATPase/DNA-binding CsgD family transcriptional regulator